MQIAEREIVDGQCPGDQESRNKPAHVRLALKAEQPKQVDVFPKHGGCS